MSRMTKKTDTATMKARSKTLMFLEAVSHVNVEVCCRTYATSPDFRIFCIRQSCFSNSFPGLTCSRAAVSLFSGPMA